ncbi:MAG: hypothetical protein R3E66_19915 [bacterium]
MARHLHQGSDRETHQVHQRQPEKVEALEHSSAARTESAGLSDVMGLMQKFEKSLTEEKPNALKKTPCTFRTVRLQRLLQSARQISRMGFDNARLMEMMPFFGGALPLACQNRR